ncbi:hypothetical protein F511_42128 [Dorcoceras hygrometricum]|uniref:Uncharacterized protein n=1 Tax=Dorcoceras hygrometricum TaxID=472368 RepID=A0A2Z7CSU6_9LAMI|nr:hypothetical protein F511_42128 [Dorcoceras hygrometricum]
MSCDDISLDVITISSWLSADDLSEQSQESADSAGRVCVLTSRKIQSQRKDFQTQCLSIQSQDEVSDASNSSIQSRAYLNQLLLYIQSRATVSNRKISRRKVSKKQLAHQS